jgi:hypothetical protein
MENILVILNSEEYKKLFSNSLKIGKLIDAFETPNNNTVYKVFASEMGTSSRRFEVATKNTQIDIVQEENLYQTATLLNVEDIIRKTYLDKIFSIIVLAISMVGFILWRFVVPLLDWSVRVVVRIAINKK